MKPGIARCVNGLRSEPSAPLREIKRRLILTTGKQAFAVFPGVCATENPLLIPGAPIIWRAKRYTQQASFCDCPQPVLNVLL
jgi:hypothetical protein